MNENTSPTLVGLLGEEGRGFFQDLPLHPQRLVLTAQPLQLLALIAREPTGTPAGVGIGLLDPVAQRHLGDPQVLGGLADRLAGQANELDRLTF